MSVSVSLQMSDEQLAPFRAALMASRCQIDGQRDDERAAELIDRSRRVDLQRVPESLRPHIAKVEEIAAMLTDRRWQTDPATREDLTAALAYFQDVDDLIPDSNPQFGLVDDAIIIELALSDHAQEWSQWHAFSRFQRAHPDLGDIGRAEWLKLNADRFGDSRSSTSYLAEGYNQNQSRSRYRLMTPLPRIDMG